MPRLHLERAAPVSERLRRNDAQPCDAVLSYNNSGEPGARRKLPSATAQRATPRVGRRTVNVAAAASSSCTSRTAIRRPPSASSPASGPPPQPPQPLSNACASSSAPIASFTASIQPKSTASPGARSHAAACVPRDHRQTRGGVPTLRRAPARALARTSKPTSLAVCSAGIHRARTSTVLS